MKKIICLAIVLFAIMPMAFVGCGNPPPASIHFSQYQLPLLEFCTVMNITNRSASETLVITINDISIQSKFQRYSEESVGTVFKIPPGDTYQIFGVEDGSHYSLSADGYSGKLTGKVQR